MAFPPQYREPPPELPSIRTPGADPFRASHYQDVPFSRSPAVSIPGVEHRVDAAPPPLPPPRILPFEGAPDMREKRDYDHSFPSSRSGYGSMDSALDDRPVLKRRDTASTNGDEGYASYSTDRSRESFPSEFGLFHTKLQLPSPADRHSDSMKKKLDPIRTSDPKFHMSDARFSPSVAVPMQLPIHSRPPMHDSPVRLLETPYSAVSPRSHPYSHWPSGPRSPQEMTDPSRSPHGRSTRHNSDDATSTHGSYGYHSAEDMEIDDTASHKRLHMESGQDNSRSKRRAPSPQTAEERNRQQLDSASHWGSHGSPTRRRGPILQGSHSSQMRSESYMNMTPSDSYGRRSPDGMSTGSRTRNSSTSPYNAAISLTHSPQSSVSNNPPVHARAVSGSDSRAVNEVQKTTGPKLQGFLMCECCPKKPRKFDTAEELKAHAAEKQYGCNYCANRFKNKNEAERHQNSLHVRRHSWSCSALSGYDRAFHESTTRPGEADTCGYCGEEFARSGRGPGSGALSGGVPPRHASEQDWEERIRHLQEVHKFRECNSSKKFYRADHFRQHLKHSHAGTSGKWTNMLENACMLEEDPTPR